MEDVIMNRKNNAIVYVKGLTKDEARMDLQKVERYCSENNLEVVEILFDETRHNEKDYDCLDALYKLMKSKNVSTIIFNSCHLVCSIATFIDRLSKLIDINVIRFLNGEIDDSFSKGKRKDVIAINQSMFDRALTVDFGNWVASLVKDRKDILYIDREENLRMIEIQEQKNQKVIKESRKGKGILGIVFDERNLELMTEDVQNEMFKDKASHSHIVNYEECDDLEELLESKKYYRVICDDLVNGDIDDLRDFIIICNIYSVEVCFWEGDLSTYKEYPLGTFLDAITGNL